MNMACSFALLTNKDKHLLWFCYCNDLYFFSTVTYNMVSCLGYLKFGTWLWKIVCNPNFALCVPILLRRLRYLIITMMGILKTNKWNLLEYENFLFFLYSFLKLWRVLCIDEDYRKFVNVKFGSYLLLQKSGMLLQMT